MVNYYYLFNGTLPLSRTRNSSLLHVLPTNDKLRQRRRNVFKNVLRRNGGLVRMQVKEEAPSIPKLCLDRDVQDVNLFPTYLRSQHRHF
jgi:hypothetical protein